MSLDEYERVPADDQEVLPHAPSIRLAKKLAWMLLGAATVYLTNLHQHLLHWRTDLHRSSFYFFVAAVTVSLASVAYLALWVKRKHGPMAMRRWRTYAPNAVQIMAGSNLVAFVAAVRLFYPIYGRWTLLLVPVLSWSWMTVLTLV